MHVYDGESDTNNIVNIFHIFTLLTWLRKTNQILLLFNYFLITNITGYGTILE